MAQFKSKLAASAAAIAADAAKEVSAVEVSAPNVLAKPPVKPAARKAAAKNAAPKFSAPKFPVTEAAPAVFAAAEVAPQIETPVFEAPAIEAPVAETFKPEAKPAPVASVPEPVAEPEPEATVAEPEPAHEEPETNAPAEVAAEASPTKNPHFNLPHFNLKEFAMNDYTANMSDSMSGAVSDVQAKLQTAYEKSTSMVTEMTELAKGNVEAMVESSKLFAAGVQDLGKSYADDAKSAYEIATADLKEMAAVKSPTELFQLQGKILRRNFETLIASTSKSTDAAMKLANEAMAPLSGRVNIATEKLTTIAA